jgi:hypothetical protein
VLGLTVSVAVVAGCAVQPTPAPLTSGVADTAAPSGGPANAARSSEAKPADAAKPAATAAPAQRQAAGAPAIAPTPAPRPPAPPVPVPPVPSVPSQPAEPAVVPAPSIGRVVIYSTDVSLLVRDLGQAIEAMTDIVAQVGGHVAGVENKEEQGQPIATVKLKVPPERYEPTMRQLRGLAVEVTEEKATTQDVTEEFNDLQTQLSALEATHAQLLELMGRAQNMEEILKIQERLGQTKKEIDRIKGRMTFLERSADLATITVRARPAADVLARSFAALRAQLRRAESQRAATTLTLKRARTPEEEATLRDRLAEQSLEIDRLTARLKDIEGKAARAGITLPAAQADEAPSTGAPADEELSREYVTLRAQLRAAQVEQDRITRELRQRRGPEDAELRDRLANAILEVNRLNARVKVVQERAAQLTITLPSLTPEQEAALAGTAVEDPSRPDVWRAARAAWDASLQTLAVAATAVVSAVVFLWWAIPPLALVGFWLRRRRPTAAAPPA